MKLDKDEPWNIEGSTAVQWVELLPRSIKDTGPQVPSVWSLHVLHVTAWVLQIPTHPKDVSL